MVTEEDIKPFQNDNNETINKLQQELELLAMQVSGKFQTLQIHSHEIEALKNTIEQVSNKHSKLANTLSNVDNDKIDELTHDI